MYFPYLRGKQFDLLAIREFSSENKGNSKIIPIIEPVKSSFSSIKLAVDVMLSDDQKFALVLNPSLGDFKKSPSGYDLYNELPKLKDNYGKWIPAIIFSSTEKVSDIILRYNLKGVMIIFPEGLDVSQDHTLNLLKRDSIEYIVIGDVRERNSREIFEELNSKKIIRLDNQFNNKTRNVDYLEKEDEFFSSEFYYYEKDGYYGFSDYLTLPKDFIDGGMLPYAIAIHLTYKFNDRKIHIHHFVSDTNFDQSNIQGKFREAAQKVEPFFTDKDKTQSINYLIQLVKDEKYPGLGYIKKLSIKNHIELINEILTSHYENLR